MAGVGIPNRTLHQSDEVIDCCAGSEAASAADTRTAQHADHRQRNAGGAIRMDCRYRGGSGLARGCGSQRPSNVRLERVLTDRAMEPQFVDEQRGRAGHAKAARRRRVPLKGR